MRRRIGGGGRRRGETKGGGSDGGGGGGRRGWQGRWGGDTGKLIKCMTCLMTNLL